MNVLSRLVRDLSISNIPAIGRPDLQLKDVEVPLLYVGIGVRSFCWAAMRFSIVCLFFGFFGSGGWKNGG